MAVYIDTDQVAGIAGISSLTLEQYNALEVKPKLWFLLNPPEGYKRLSADEVSYDGTNSGLSATDTQGAIDELSSRGNVKYVDYTLPSDIVVSANGVNVITTVPSTTISGFIMNYNNSNLTNLQIYIDKWYSNIRLDVRNFSSSSVTIPSGTGVRYFYIEE